MIERRYNQDCTHPRSGNVDSQQYGIESIDLTDFEPDSELLARFPSQNLFRESVLPLRITNNCIRVAVSDPLNLAALDELTACCGYLCEAVLAPTEQIQAALRKALGVGGGTVHELVAMSTDEAEALQAAAADEIDDLSQASSVVKLVNEVLIEAVEQRASDIHIEPDDDDLVVRFRVDGMLRVQPMPTEIKRFRAAIVSRLKIMSRLNIAEKRLPQDGRIRLSVGGREIDVRVSIIPMLHGESVVMRLLDKSHSTLNLDHIQFPTELRDTWNRLIRRSHGMILVTGPTGSGKTTTLYSSLCNIRSPELKIVTVEDPIEYNLRQISQIQVHEKIDLTFAAGLRSILRHDPDVILIGEIRDEDTATSAIQASLTGHLVLSTLHTNDAAGAFTRLIDMGIAPYLVASTVEAVLAQRLLRRLCKHCRQSVTLSRQDLPEDLHSQDACVTVYEAQGCRECHNTGYQGRTAIFELLPTSRDIRTACSNSMSSSVIREKAVAEGMQTLRQCGWDRVLSGETTIAELSRVCPPDEE